MITCPICDKHFKQLTNKHLSLHNMTTHDFKSQFPNHPLVDQDVLEKNQTNRKIGKQSSVIKQKQKQEDCKASYLLHPTVCAECGSSLPYTHRHHQFCNRSCAAIYTNKHRDYTMSDATKQQISTKMKALGVSPRIAYMNKHNVDHCPIFGRKRIPYTITVCAHCLSEFEHKINTQRKFCSALCRKLNSGGYRPNSTRVHKHVYRGFQLDSGAELVFAELLSANNIEWTKNTSLYFLFTDRQSKTRKYYPDFFLPEKNLWVEIKGKRYLREDDDLRLASVGNIIRIMSTELKDSVYVLNMISSAAREFVYQGQRSPN